VRLGKNPRQRGGASHVGTLEAKSRKSFVRLSASTPARLAPLSPEMSEAMRQAGINITPLNAERYASEKKSTVLVVGLSVHRTPVELRERLAVPEAEVPRVIEELCSYPHIQEAAVLSTCNRLEVYVVARSFHPAVREVEAWMCASSGVALEELQGSLFLARDDAAAEHLMTVSSGLDSLVVGEGQILAQVRQLHLMGQAVKGFGRVLNALFKSAVTIGKRVRSETPITEGAVSVSGAAAELAAQKLEEGGDPASLYRPALRDSNIAIVGAGKMARLLVKHLQGKGINKVTVINRSMARAETLSEEFPAVDMEIIQMAALSNALDASDVVFFASGANEVLVDCHDAADMAAKPRMFVDISVPRNVAAAVKSVEGFDLYNVDDLREVVEANKVSRSGAAVAARALIAAEVRSFCNWKHNLDAVPKIRSLRDKAGAVTSSQIAKCVTKLENKGEALSPAQAAAVEQMLNTAINKLLHDPITAMRTLPQAADNGEPSLLEDAAHPWLHDV